MAPLIEALAPDTAPDAATLAPDMAPDAVNVAALTAPVNTPETAERAPTLLRLLPPPETLPPHVIREFLKALMCAEAIMSNVATRGGNAMYQILQAAACSTSAGESWASR